MISSIMNALLLGSATLSLQAAASSHPKVVKMPISSKHKPHSLNKRDPFTASIQNFIPYGEYFITASVGTPAQEVELVLDTGSSDIWMFGPNACSPDQGCQGGTFNRAKSSTYGPVNGGTGAFRIQYETPGSGVQGDYITDVLSIGGVSVTNQTMAVATSAKQVNTGIMGVGLATNEAAVSQNLGQYPNLADSLVAQGKISSKSYSLYLDDLARSRGSIVFGGYDYDKFQGDLTMLPIQVDDQTGMRTSFTVSWTSIGVDSPGNEFALETPDFVYGAVLDSGTTLTYMPTELYEPLARYFNTTTSNNPDLEGTTFVDCNVGKTHPGQLVFGLGGNDGVQIAVDFDELAVPVFDTRNGQQIRVKGTPACQFGLDDAGQGYSILFGQTFLRSAYVLYDLDNLQLGVAQTIFDVNSTNIMVYNGKQTTGRISTDGAEPTVAYMPATAAAGGGSVAPGGFGTALGSLLGLTGGLGLPTGALTGGLGSPTGALTGGLDATQAGAVATSVATSFSITQQAHPTIAVPNAFPTDISAATTGRIDVAGSGNSGTGSNNNSGSSSSGKNDAGSISPVFATAGVLMLALFTTMLML